jgi:hypothetical protein
MDVVNELESQQQSEMLSPVVNQVGLIVSIIILCSFFCYQQLKSATLSLRYHSLL